MRAYQLTNSDGFLNSLRSVELPSPVPGPGQIRIRMRAASLNYRDLMASDGRYGKIAFPLIPLSDGAGEVEAVGDGVTRFRVGDRVAATFFQGWIGGPFHRGVLETALGGALPGVLAEQVVVSEEGAVLIPSHLSFVEGSTLPCAALTAWHALVVSGGLSEGQTVLVLGTGGVSTFALQIAKAHRAKVIVISSSDAKLEKARALGADETIHYGRVPDWEKEVFRMTGKRGVNHVVEVGGHATFGRSLRSLAMEGRIHVVGGVSGFATELSLIDLISKRASVTGIYVGSREMFECMIRMFETHGIRPVVDRVIPFDQAVEAYRYQHSAAHFGKVVISLEP